MNKWRIKLFRVILLSMVIILSGCNKQENDYVANNSSTTVGLVDNAENDFGKSEYIDLERCFEQVAANESTIVGTYTEKNEVILVYYDKEKSGIEKEIILSGVREVQSIDIASNDNVYITEVVEEDKSVFLEIDQNGDMHHLGMIELEDTANARYTIPKGLFVDDTSGYYYIWYEMGLPSSEVLGDDEENIYVVVDRIYVKDTEMNPVFYEQVANVNGGMLLDFNVNALSRPVIIAKDREGLYIYEMDADKKTTGNEVRLKNVAEFQNIYGNISSTDEGLWLCCGNSLYNYEYDKKEMNKIISLSECGIVSSDILYLECSADRIEIIDNYTSNKNSELIILEKGKNEKDVVTLGTIQVAQDLERAVTSFNRYNKDTKIEFVQYYDDNKGFDESVNKLKQDIVQGVAPDIMEVSVIDYEMLADKSALENLFAYMEGDEECSIDMIMPSVLEAYTLDEKLYNISPSFQLYSIWGKNSIIQNKTGITLKELMEVLKNNEKSLNNIYGFSADETVLTTLCTFGMNEFIDWEKGICDFESDYFYDLLSFAKEYEGGYRDGSASKGIKENEIVMTVGVIDSIADYQIQQKLYLEEIDFVGYPTNNNAGTALGYRGSQLSINSKSDEKEKAWEFVKYYILNGYSGEGFPTLKMSFEESMKAAMQKDYIVTEEGKHEAPKATYWDEDAYIEVYEAEQKDIDTIKKLISDAKNKFKYNTMILNIINEEASAYFQGQKSVDDVASLIQNKVTLYLQEQMK